MEAVLEAGAHTVQAPAEVGVGPGAKLVFEKWADGVGAAAREVYVSGRTMIEALYAKFYRVSVASRLGVACCSGWYREGSPSGGWQEPPRGAPPP